MSFVDKYFFSRLIEGFVCIVWGNVFHSWVVDGMNEFAYSSVYEREWHFRVVVFDDTGLLLKLEVVLSSIGIRGTGD